MGKSNNTGFTAVFVALAAFLLLFATAAAAEVNVQFPASTGIGKPFVLRVTSSIPLTGVEVVWQGRTTPLAITTWNERYIALGLLGTQVGKAKTGGQTLILRLFSGNRKSEHRLPVKVTPVKYREDHLTLPESMVTPPASELERIAAERQRTAKALATMTTERRWGLPIVRPVSGIVTSPYGRRRILNGKPRAHHAGVDFRAATGTPVSAALPGTVVLTGDHYYAGKSVYVDSGGGAISHYFHLQSIDVKEGDTVKAGQIIAKTGSTGRSTGPHLHFGLSLSGQMVDTEPLFTATIAQMLEKAAFSKIVPAWK